MSESDLLPEQRPPSQRPAISPGQIDAKITCSPALGQPTSISRNQNSVKFTVLLESPSSPLGSDSVEPVVCLWHNHNGHHDWSELQLQPSESFSDVLLADRPDGDDVVRRWFTAELPGQPKHGHVVSFTVKFRLSTKSDWSWVKETSGIRDGHLHYQTTDWQKHQDYPLGHFLQHISPEIHVGREAPDTPETFLYSLTGTVAPAKGQDSGVTKYTLGKVKGMSRWFSLVRLWSPWLAPRQGGSKFELDKDGVLISFLQTDGLHVVLLAVSGVQDVLTTFEHDSDGNVIIKGRNDREEPGQAHVLIAVADSFEVANAAVMYHARKMVMNFPPAVNADAETKALMDEKVKPEWLEEWFDGLTYCTWNGLGQDLTDEKVFHALNALESENINITNLIIDDNWQSLSDGDSQFQRAWDDFEGNKDIAPNGMKQMITNLRQKHPRINHIAVWHAILGYWGGVDPKGKLAKKYKTIEVDKEPGVAGGPFTVIAAEDAKKMYDDFYSFLSSCGIDSVKTDAQFFLDLLQNAPDRRALTTEYQDAWTLAHLRHFSSRAISCMSQSPQLLFYEQLPTNKPRLLVRNSDDFFPEVEASHPWHIFCNAHNSLLTQHLNVLPDWDMFQTSHPWASFHGAARCVSGGPIYFTDYPGQHDFKLLQQMTAYTARGKSVILRPHAVGKAMNPYNGYDDLALLKIGTYVGFARTGTGILGIFNCSPQPLAEFVHLSDFPGTEEGEYVIGAFTSGEVSPPVKRGDEQAMAKVELKKQGWEILSAYAVKTLQMDEKHGKVAVANMGLLGKMTGSAAVTGCDIYIEDNGRLRVWTSLKALGTLGESPLYSRLSILCWRADVVTQVSTSPRCQRCLSKKISWFCSLESPYRPRACASTRRLTRCWRSMWRRRGGTVVRMLGGAMRLVSRCSCIESRAT